ncbi:HAD family hydrolase [Neorhizobium galegae]|uniref:Phosphatase belonging to the HAD superfamily n=1 Tax=Neorhizobium galegae bv. officinalis TaxID=323656 RepID=A0A0T7GIJ7_NEOGA|nr:HAD family hydrolase [Neorhizobium galegae]CDZ47105.1 Phosphatase belonging to the HAD superfamily [Neorhizobium galegae bv. officinalis]
MKKREKLFIFDIGGVFVKLDPASRDRAVSKAGGAGPSMRYGDVPEAIFRDFRLGRSTESDYVQALTRVFDVPHESIYEAEHAYVAEGFHEFIAFVRRLRENHRVVCLSNNQAIHWRHISENLLGAGYFDREYLSHEMGLEKPDRVIFEAVSQAEGCSEKDVFFIDDIEENVLSAREVGWQHCIVHRDSVETAKLLMALAAEQTLN